MEKIGSKFPSAPLRLNTTNTLIKNVNKSTQLFDQNRFFALQF
jgi:hypothetical protein